MWDPRRRPGCRGLASRTQLIRCARKRVKLFYLFPVPFLFPCALYVNIQISNSEIQGQTSSVPGVKARTEEGGAGLEVEASVVAHSSQ